VFQVGVLRFQVILVEAHLVWGKAVLNKQRERSEKDLTSQSAFHSLSGMLLLGSAGRNSGKTEFACSVLRTFARNRKIIGMKVTVIRRTDGTCPRGGKGCGVCSSLEGDFCITEETNRSSGKDTSRLLDAGADRVFWLRVMSSRMTEGLTALIAIMGGNVVSVCESNSLRQVVRPGLFLMIKDKGSAVYKASAEAVRKYTDRIVLSDGRSFDLDLSDLRLFDNRWVLREHAGAIILAGGKSGRMEQDKSMLRIDGRPIIEHVCDQLRLRFDDVLISANDAEKYTFLDLKVVADRVPSEGPLMGIASALEASEHDLNLVVACDIPEIDVNLAHRMLSYAKNYDAVVPRVGGRLLEPLFAVYRKSTVTRINKLLASGERRVRRLFDFCRTRFVDVPVENAVTNLNTMKEYLAHVDGEDVAV